MENTRRTRRAAFFSILSNPATIMILLKLGWDWWSNPSAFSLSGFYLIINLIAALVYLSYFSPGKSSQPAALLEAET